ncbi:hypothetical protein [uncultured Methylobacterium sp.]|uniref:hypothetical protein n=1 Tax=uncultured Methylobacterium sp. TaxID=157278 RepID=UPI002595AB18|nr:hypothetical protein [uncultured Methylobacterium sp.]
MLADGAAVEPSLIDAVMEIAEDLMTVRDVVDDFMRIDNVDRLMSFLTLSIERVPEPLRRDALLDAASRTTTGLHAAALLVALLGRDHQVVWISREPRDPPLVSRADLDRIGSAVAERIDRAAEAGTLATKPTIGPPLRVWSTFAGVDAPSAWVAARLSDPTAALDLAFEQMHRVNSSAPPYQYRDIDRLPDPAFVDAAAFADAVEGHLPNVAVPENDRFDAERFVRKVRRLLSAPGTRTSRPILTTDSPQRPSGSREASRPPPPSPRNGMAFCGRSIRGEPGRSSPLSTGTARKVSQDRPNSLTPIQAVLYVFFAP